MRELAAVVLALAIVFFIASMLVFSFEYNASLDTLLSRAERRARTAQTRGALQRLREDPACMLYDCLRITRGTDPSNPHVQQAFIEPPWECISSKRRQNLGGDTNFARFEQLRRTADVSVVDVYEQ